MRIRQPILAALALLAFIGAAADDPAERLADPAKETHARALFAQVRCVVCQNESIDDSEAELAGDLRRAIRDQVVQGRSDDQIRAFLVARYGDFILLKPRFTLGNSPLWLTPFLIVLVGGAYMTWRAWRSGPTKATAALTPQEQARLSELDAN